MLRYELRQSAEFRNHERAYAVPCDRQHHVMRSPAATAVLLLEFGHVSAQRTLVRVDFQRTEIVVHAVVIAAMLVVPAAGRVNRTGRVERVDAFGCVARVELAPAFVEQRPRHDGGVPAEHVHHRVARTRPVAPVDRVVRAERREMFGGVVAEFVPCGADERRLAIRGPRIVFAVRAAAGHRVLPDEHAEAVAMVVPAGRLDFDVLAQHVEAGVFHGRDVMRQRLVVGRGHEAVRPVALVKHAFDEERLAVEMEARYPLRIRFDFDGTERAVGTYDIHRLRPRDHRITRRFRGFRRPVSQFGPHVIQIRIGRRPQMFGSCCDFRTHLAHARRQRLIRHHRAVRRVGDDDVQFRVRLVAADFRTDEQLAVECPLECQRAQVGFRHDFQPDALPNAALRGVPDAFALDFLLAAQLRARIVRIVDAQRDFKRVIRVDKCRNIDVERQVAADVRARELAVDIAGADIIDRFEMQDEAIRVADLPDRFLSAERDGMHDGAVPQQVVGVNGLVHAGQRGFRRERYEDLAVERLRNGGFLDCADRFVAGQHRRRFAPFRRGFVFRNGRDRVIPPAIEHGAVVAYHGRARVLAEYGGTTLVQRAFAFLGGIERLVAGARGQPFMVDSFTPRCPQLLQRLTGTHFRRSGLQYAFDIQHGEPLPAALHVSAFYCTERLAFFNDSYRGLKYRLATPRQDQLKNRTHFYPKQCESNRNIPTKRMRSVVYAL